MSDLTPAASAGAPLGWRSIESAPRDGTLFLACNLDQAVLECIDVVGDRTLRITLSRDGGSYGFTAPESSDIGPIVLALFAASRLAALAEKAANQCVVAPPKTRYFPADFAPAYQTVAAGGLALPADPLPRIITLPGRHADPDAFAVNLSATIGDDAGACGICDVVFITGDRCLTDISLGPVHARCCGPERESYVDLETGDALAADAPIPTPWIWNADGTISPAEVAA